MQISVSKLKEAQIPLAAEAGFFGVDESFAGIASREDILDASYERTVMARYAKVRAAGLAVCQTHLTYQPSHIPPIGDGSYADYEACLLPVLEKEIALTAAMGCPTAVMHPYFEEDRARSREGNLRLIEKLMPLLERHHVVLALENIYALKMGDAHHSTAEDMLYYTEQFQSPNVGLCLDTGHAVIRGQKPDEFLEKIVHRLSALHLHTTIPGADMHAIPCVIGGYDRIQWTRIGQILAESSYAGTFNLEISQPSKLSERAAALYYKLAYQIARDTLAAD